MRVIPVLDLRGGIAVHARGGERARYAPVESALAPAARGDALALVRAYRQVLGAEEIYVADLDAIERRGRVASGRERSGLVAEIAALGCRAWVDAGVVSARDAARLANEGAARVIAGLETLPDADALRAAVSALGRERVAFSLDLRDGEPLAAVAELRRMAPVELAAMAADAGVSSTIVLDVARTGTGRGVDLELVRRLAEVSPGVEIVAGGGIGSAADLRALAAAGAHAALVASALHDGRIGSGEIAAARAA